MPKLPAKMIKQSIHWQSIHWQSIHSEMLTNSERVPWPLLVTKTGFCPSLASYLAQI